LRKTQTSLRKGLYKNYPTAIRIFLPKVRQRGERQQDNHNDPE